MENDWALSPHQDVMGKSSPEEPGCSWGGDTEELVVEHKTTGGNPKYEDIPTVPENGADLENVAPFRSGLGGRFSC